MPRANRKSNSNSSNNLVYLNRDRGYRWQDLDRDMEELCAIISKSGLSSGQICNEVYIASGHVVNPHYRTIDNWLNGKTRKPSNFLLYWVGYALGYERKGWVPISNSTY